MSTGRISPTQHPGLAQHQRAAAASHAVSTAVGSAVGNAVESAAAVAGGVADSVTDAAETLVRVVKPRLRGWIHAVTAPLSLAACIVLTALAPTAGLAWASAAYLVCSLLLFANSGVYHISNGHFPQAVTRILQRVDHANIYLLIAGTYTPLSVALLDAGTARLVLGIVWGGAAAGIITTLAWPSAPRWLATLFYVILGWVAIWFLPSFWSAGGPAIVWLIIAGGVAYTVGAVVYARRWPNPAPRWFGFHEIFHVCTVIAWACQCTACFLAVLG